jgi:hypothetical protein
MYKGNIPNPNLEYIYRLDVAWPKGAVKSVTFMKGNIVSNVILNEKNSMYEFIVKKTGEEFSCSYGWAFAENTPINIDNIEIYESYNEKFQQMEKICDKLRNNITTLDTNKIELRNRRINQIL